MNDTIAGDSVWGKMSVMLHIWIKSGCLNGIMTGDVCCEVSVLLHVWIKSGCLNGVTEDDMVLSLAFLSCYNFG